MKTEHCFLGTPSANESWNNLLLSDSEKKDFSEKLEKLYTAIEATEIFIKELFLIVKGSIENIEVKTEN